ncbi:MAG: hypothetical protein WKG07_12650 [Hymenobacter sp.]
MLTLLRENDFNEKELAQYTNHQHGIGNVGGVMKAIQSAERRVVGLVDLDKRFHEQPYLAQFELRAGSLSVPLARMRCFSTPRALRTTCWQSNRPLRRGWLTGRPKSELRRPLMICLPILKRLKHTAERTG